MLSLLKTIIKENCMLHFIIFLPSKFLTISLVYGSPEYHSFGKPGIIP